MSSLSPESSKSVYLELPLLAPEDEADESTTTTKNKSMLSSSSALSSILHYSFGATMGMVCFYAVPSLVFPLLPQMTYFWAYGMFLAFVWSVITTGVAFYVWFGYIFVFQTWLVLNHDGIEKEESVTNKAWYWEEREQCYTVGACLGFGVACLVSFF